jgi:hypothetical protein
LIDERLKSGFVLSAAPRRTLRYVPRSSRSHSALEW